jgi:hypothetical protein
MAIYHLSVKTISRSAGRSATASAAYRSGDKIHCNREDKTFDYSKKQGIEHTEIFSPADSPEWVQDRGALWNAAEAAELRKNSTVAREFEVAFPDELNPSERLSLVRGFAQSIVERHRCVVDIALHEPSRDGDERNHHAHIMLTTRRITPNGFAEKTRELDEKKSGEVVYWREQWANHSNRALERSGSQSRIDHRSLKDQGIDREPTIKMGYGAVALEFDDKRTERGDINYEIHTSNHIHQTEKIAISDLDQEILLSEQLLELLKQEHAQQIEQKAAKLAADLEAIRAEARAQLAMAQAQIKATQAAAKASEKQRLMDEAREQLRIDAMRAAEALRQQRIDKLLVQLDNLAQRRREQQPGYRNDSVFWRELPPVTQTLIESVITHGVDRTRQKLDATTLLHPEFETEATLQSAFTAHDETLVWLKEQGTLLDVYVEPKSEPVHDRNSADLARVKEIEKEKDRDSDYDMGM